jgi:hypothetical protein
MYNRKDVDRLARIMGRPRLSAKDRDLYVNVPPPLLASIDSVTFCALTFRLEEMHEYCENALSCRRQTFSDKFTETRSRLNRCGRMCDNCKHQGGAARRTFLPPKPGVTVLENVKATTTTTTIAATRPTGNAGKRNYSRLIEDEEVDDDGWIAAKAPRPTTVDGGNPTAASITSKPAAPPKAGFVKASMWTGAPSSSSSSKQPSTSAALQSSEQPKTVATNAMLPSRSFLYEDSDDEDLTYLQATTTKPSTATRPTAVGRSTFANTKTNAICIDDDDDDHDDVVDTGGRPPLAARFQKASQLRR